MRRTLVTGGAGFIGYHVVDRLLARGGDVVALDNLNDYYDPALKQARLAQLTGREGFRFVQGDLGDRDTMRALFDDVRPTMVINLAAQAGVRYSITNPEPYVHSNVTGFLHVLEGCRRHQVRHLVYASSSSVYGTNARLPFGVQDSVDHPLSLYAATKKANELMAHVYSHLYGVPTTGLRFFTVYGPWGRPDMAYFRFTRAILEGQPIDVYNHGDMQRDFTYIDDIVEGVMRVLDRPPAPDPGWDASAGSPGDSHAPFRVYNIGNSRPVQLLDFIAVLESALGRRAIQRLLPMQPGDVRATWADVEALEREFGYRPSTPIEVGVRRFAEWYMQYYRV